jgi:hypothetical protein
MIRPFLILLVVPKYSAVSCSWAVVLKCRGRGMNRRDHSEDLGVDGRIIFRCFFNKGVG